MSQNNQSLVFFFVISNETNFPPTLIRIFIYPPDLQSQSMHWSEPPVGISLYTVSRKPDHQHMAVSSSNLNLFSKFHYLWEDYYY